MFTQQTYTVQSGETLALIAQKIYGDGNLWELIYNANRHTIGENPNQIQVGMVLVIPAKDSPNPTNPNPPSGGTRLNLEATFYSMEETNCHPPASGVHGITLEAALSGQWQSKCQGESLGRVQCAVDPNVIPLGKNFTLVLWDGREVPATALDKGTAVLGNKIDIFVDTVNEAINLGRKPVTVIL
ncbi:MAG: 3D domain-containing protein [Lyngbya sp.]|nr:3D domain-containing protein [Lyngbya sp.]